MLKKIKQGYNFGYDLSKLLKHAENDLDPVLFPEDYVGRKYNEIHKKVSQKGIFSELGFRGYFLFNPLDKYQRKIENRILYLELRKKGIIIDDTIKTIDDIL